MVDKLRTGANAPLPELGLNSTNTQSKLSIKSIFNSSITMATLGFVAFVAAGAAMGLLLVGVSPLVCLLLAGISLAAIVAMMYLFISPCSDSEESQQVVEQNKPATTQPTTPPPATTQPAASDQETESNRLRLEKSDQSEPPQEQNDSDERPDSPEAVVLEYN